MTDSHVSRRKFFTHSAHQTIGVSTGLAAFKACDLNRLARAGSSKRGQGEPATRVLLISGSVSYKSGESLAALQQHLRENYQAKCLRAFSEHNHKLPGLENLEDCDCALFFTRRMEIDGEPLQRIRRYCRRGGAIVGVRSASHGLQNWPEMDQEVFGGDYQGQYDNQITEVKAVEGAKDHPILAGVGPFRSHGTLYKNPHLAPDTTVLLSGEFPGHRQPVAWTRLHHGGGVFYTSLGHPNDFRDPNFLRLLSNALQWSCGRRL